MDAAKATPVGSVPTDSRACVDACASRRTVASIAAVSVLRPWMMYYGWEGGVAHEPEAVRCVYADTTSVPIPACLTRTVGRRWRRCVRSSPCWRRSCSHSRRTWSCTTDWCAGTVHPSALPSPLPAADWQHSSSTSSSSSTRVEPLLCRAQHSDGLCWPQRSLVSHGA